MLVMIFFFTFCINADAVTLRQLYNELSSLEKSYNASKARANLSQAEMANIKASIASAEAEIKQAQQEIIAAENEIQKSEAEIEKKKEETNQMLLYLQIMNSHGDSMLEYVMDADNYTDFIYRYSVVTQMSDYNTDLMNQLHALINQLNEKKTNLAKRQDELAKKKVDLQAKYLIVQAQAKAADDDGQTVAQQIADKKKNINYYKNMGCTMDQDVTSCSGMAAVDGWTSPLAHYYQSSAYGESRGSVRHWAVDLAVSEGTPVRAVANGKVLQVRSSSCGGLVIQIQHYYRGTDYVSLYMHLLSGTVGYKQDVQGGQIIGYSGGGPQEVSRYGDVCTQGAHLHFAMSVGASAIQSSSRRDSTFDPVRFFPAMKGIGSRL